MRVLVLAHLYAPAHNAGAETMLHAMLRALVSRGHRVDVSLSRQSGEPYALDGVNVWPYVDKRDVFRWLESADVLVSHLENTTRTTMLGNFNSKPVVIICHNTMDATFRSLVQPQARVDLAVMNSEWMTADFQRWAAENNCEMPATTIVRPLVKLDEYMTAPGDRVTLINLRKMDHSRGFPMGKGSELFWELACRLPRIPFLGVIGAYGEQEVHDLPNVEIVDHLPHARMRDEVYARTRVLLTPSSYESWGRVALEAMCSGIPVVSSPTPGLLECLGPAGTFHDPADVDVWERTVRRLMTYGPAWQKASTAARARAVEMARLDDLSRWADAVEATASRGALAMVR